jgi:hypothetical protein
MEGESEEDIINFFLDWLSSNGATFPKLEWPSNATESGIRGAIAREDIEPLEPMLSIPVKLMMCQPHATADPLIGPSLKANQDIVQEDILLAIYIMWELHKGKSSFFYPYLRMLPTPGALSEWTDSEIKQLQDSKLAMRVRSRRTMIERLYFRHVRVLLEREPEVFPEEAFTFEQFKFAWLSIQGKTKYHATTRRALLFTSQVPPRCSFLLFLLLFLFDLSIIPRTSFLHGLLCKNTKQKQIHSLARAFGKRLPWSALVPFADCLNHANLQTKYDYHQPPKQEHTTTSPPPQAQSSSSSRSSSKGDYFARYKLESARWETTSAETGLQNGFFRLFPSGSNHYVRGTFIYIYIYIYIFIYILLYSRLYHVHFIC